MKELTVKPGKKIKLTFANPDFMPHNMMLVKPGTLPKTSSGKLQRARCRELYLGEELELA